MDERQTVRSGPGRQRIGLHLDRERSAPLRITLGLWCRERLGHAEHRAGGHAGQVRSSQKHTMPFAIQGRIRNHTVTHSQVRRESTRPSQQCQRA